MREILGRRRKLLFRRGGRPALLGAALHCATEWQWPVLPGVGLQAAVRPPGGRTAGGRTTSGWPGRAERAARPCSCPDPDCPVPGAHPFDPGLFAATTDARMVRWWWTNRPDAPVVLATGGRAPCAVSLPAVAGARALAALDHFGVRLGPVVATPTRWSLLVSPYCLEELGELLHSHAWVPSSLRFHGEGGYVVLPPSQIGAGKVRWERPPAAGTGAPWLPQVATIVDALVAASTSAPDGGSRLAY
ncbi:bifunctional DNA primase/polymerase [Streptomyces sp. MST-110588]|uniref:bifunctional DNA primase/polymerase n=1 Tax=Streptomyces sp. MST-110588 TaxID=2833628 RepID=UPI001F5CBA78|nr:bifunctional DNA primase/polymerase [Streptomyces sp. MST-110588]UNO40864.1 bifunctional DNA primase/polymerase [Streptomyces sp. MST-110588]